MTALQKSLWTGGASSNQARELIWEHTIFQVIRLFQEAEKRIRTAERRAYYGALNGWWRSKEVSFGRGLTAKVPTEEAISEAILEEIKYMKEDAILNNSQLPSDITLIHELEFALEVPRRRKKGIGKFAKPTDICVYRVGSEVIDLRIEAKVLIKEKDIGNSYLSNQGLKRFSDPNEPYTEHEIGGMVAYTVSDSRDIWLKRISNAFTKSNPEIPSFTHHIHTLTSETLFCRVPFFPKINGARKEVSVFHLVLEFDSEPSVR